MAEAQAEASAKAGGGLEESTYGHHARVESTRISRVLRGLDSYQPHEVNCGADGGHARPSGRVAWFARMIVRYHCLAFWGFLSLARPSRQPHVSAAPAVYTYFSTTYCVRVC